jgi:hypothetical protein
VKEVAHQIVREGGGLRTLTSALDLSRARLRKGFRLKDTNRKLIVDEPIPFLAARDVANLILGTERDMQTGSPHPANTVVAGFNVEDVASLVMSGYRVLTKRPLGFKDETEEAKDEVLRGKRALEPVTHLLELQKAGHLDAVSYVRAVSKSDDPALTRAGISLALKRGLSLSSPMLGEAYSERTETALAKEVKTSEPMRVTIEVVAPGHLETEVIARVTDFGIHAEFWGALPTNVVRIDEADDKLRRLLLLSGLLDGGVDVDLNVTIELPDAKGKRESLRGTLARKFDEGEVVERLLKDLALQYGLDFGALAPGSHETTSARTGRQ